MRYLFLLFTIFFTLVTFSQGETNNWYFGRNAGLTFNTPSPTALLNGALNTHEGCATISDAAGNLLFYTDGMKVWNKNHQIMPGGTDLKGHPSAQQSGIIVPKPGSSTRYYIFTASDWLILDGTYYSEVDMTGDGGLGIVVPSTKNTQLLAGASASEKLAVTLHSNGMWYWLITHGNKYDQKYYAWLIDCNGVSTTPVVSSASLINNAEHAGAMCVSPDGTKLATAIFEVPQGVELANFNNTTGVVSNPQILDNGGVVGGVTYGVAFSPNSKVLYATNMGPTNMKHIDQWDLTQANIPATRIHIGTTISGERAGSLQLAPDNKIYVAQEDAPYLGVIHNPNTVGMGCGFVSDYIYLNGRDCAMGLPPFVSSFFTPLVVNPTITATQTCPGDPVNFTLSISPTYPITWVFGDGNTSTSTNPTHTYASAGTYNIQLIRHAVCDDTITKTITVNTTPAAVTITPSTTATFCTGSAPVTLTASGASVYSWSNGSTSSSITVSPSSTTTYTVTTGSGSCSASDSYMLTVVAPPTINGSALVTPSNCSSNTGSISGLSIGGSGLMYSWTDVNNTVVSTTSVASGLGPGTYTLTVTNSSGCSATSSSYTIGNTAAATVGLSSDKSAICNGGSVTLIATGASSYSWDNALPSSSTNTVSPTTTTVYTVTGTDANGCTNTASLTVTVHANPASVAITPSQNGALCIGDPAITLTASGASTYSWSNGATTPTISVSPLTPTNYSVTATDGNGCSGTASYLLTVNPLPTVSANGLSVGLSNCDIANGSISGLVIGGTAPFLYSWTNASGTLVGTTLDVSGLPAGTYTLEVMDNNSCIATFGVVTVNNPPTPATPTIGADKNMLCEGETATLTMFSTYMIGTTSDWTLPNGTTTAEMPLQVSNFSASDEGSYCLSSTYLGCVSDAQCLTLSMLPAPEVQIVNSGAELTICQGTTAVLSASGATNYVWTGPNSFLWTGSTVHVAPFNPINEGVYTVKGIDLNGCSQTDSVFVSMLFNPVLSVSNDGMLNLYCEHTQALLTASGASTYEWTGPNNFSSSGSVISIPEMTPPREGWYVVTGVDEHGCLATDSIKIGLSIPNMPIVLDDRHVVCPGETVHFSVDLPQASAYSWVGPNGYITDLPYFTLDSVLADDVGWYYFTAFDSIGCPQQDSIYLSVELRASCLHIPDLITPDGDNFNDTWHIPHLHYFPNVEVSIFNRWGTIIYHTGSYQNEWYGQINKNNQTVLSNTGVVPVGTYFFIMTLNDPQKTPPIKGVIDVQY